MSGLFALAPPLGIGARLLLVGIGIALGAGLGARLKRRASSPTRKSAALATSLILGLLFIGDFDGRGVFAFIGALIAGGTIAGPSISGREKQISSRWLVITSLVVGPLLGLGLFALSRWQTHYTEWDGVDAFFFAVFTVFGTFAGAVAAVLVAWFGQQSPEPRNEKDAPN